MIKGIIYIADNLFETLLAVSSCEQERGLMHIDPPAPIMSFIYEKPQINKFWMHNTKAPLDILFCNNGEVTQICKGEPYSTKIIGDNMLSNLVIELPYGTVKSSDIRLNQKVGLVYPTIIDLKKFK